MTQASAPTSKPPATGFSIAGLAPSALSDIVQEAQRAVVGGTSLASQRHVTDVELKARLDAVRALCDKGQFEQALTAAIELHLLQPRDGRHAFVVGTCLQHLGKHAQALGCFTLAAFTEPCAAARFRAGECLLALGHGEDAALVFQQAAAAAPANTPLHALAAAAATHASPPTKAVSPAQPAH